MPATHAVTVTAPSFLADPAQLKRPEAGPHRALRVGDRVRLAPWFLERIGAPPGDPLRSLRGTVRWLVPRRPPAYRDPAAAVRWDDDQEEPAYATAEVVLERVGGAR